MMQTDIKSTHLNASGVIFAGRSRVRGYQIAPSGTAGQIDFYDNATTNSGNIMMSVDTTANTAIISTTIPAEGILFQNGVYVVLPASTKITVFYA
jgi:acyl-CoA hydrolase